MSAELPTFFTHFFPWPVMAVGGSLMVGALRGMIRAMRSLRWPTVQGKVVLSKIEVSDTGGDYSHNLYCPVIEYRYTVDGVARTSRKLAIADFNPGGEARAEAILRRYKTGSSVRVYYSPEDPTLAILEPGMRWPLLGKFIGGLFFLAAGLALLLVFGGLFSSR